MQLEDNDFDGDNKEKSSKKIALQVCTLFQGIDDPLKKISQYLNKQ